MEIIAAAVFLLFGAGLLVKGSEWLTDATAELAKSWGTTHLALGLILVSTVLSLPELLVAIITFQQGHPQVGVGVSIGSVIVNLGLIIGVAAMIRPFRIPARMIARDGVFMLVATIVVILVALEDMQLTARDGIIFILLFVPYALNVYLQEKQLAKRETRKEAESITTTLFAFGRFTEKFLIKGEILLFALGGILMLGGADLFTRGMIGMAQYLSISDVVMGLTLGALGPSLPNLAVAVQSARRGFSELAISQSIGSNIFTLFITMGILSMLQPIQLTRSFETVVAPMLLLVTAVSFVFMLRGRIGRPEGAVLVLLYLLAQAAQILFGNA